MASARVDKGFIPELDGLRGIAILLVMVHRFWPRSATGFTAEAAGAGWIGVDLFFVISGFLIAGILLDTKNEPGYFRNFYARRVLRIFPLYYLFVGGVLLAFSSPEFREHSGSPLWYLVHLGNVPEALLGRDVPYWLAPVWSLAIEEQFYLTFPWLVAAVSRRRLAQILVGIIIAAPLIRLGTTLAFPDRERIQYLFTLCRLDTIAIGCLLGVAVRAIDLEAWRARLPRIAGGVFGTALVIALVTGLDRTTLFGRTLGYSVVAVGCASAVMLVLLARDARITQPLRFAWLRYLGKLCFGIYLLHRPADTFVTALAGTPSVWFLPAKIAVAVGLATISWHLLERPFLALKARFASHHHPAGTAIDPTATPSLVTRLLIRAGLISLVVVPLASCNSPNVQPSSDDAPGFDTPPLRDAAPDADERDAYMGDPDAMLPDGAVEQAGVVLYPEGARHSPITPDLATRLAAINAAHPHTSTIFLKVGDSITSLPYFLRCFDGGSVDLGTHTDLAATRARYLTGHINSDTPYTRTSDAAVGGTCARDALAGSPSPLSSEISTANGHVAFVMFGTNEIRMGKSYEEFATSLWDVVDTLLANGVIPIMSTIPPLNDYPEADARIPTANSFVRAIAQGRGVPLGDFHRELLPLPDRGLGSDDLHPSVSPNGACILTPAGLQYGFNVRNLLSLEALTRVDAALSGTAPDATAPTRQGFGTAASPFLGTLPLASLGNTHDGEAVASCSSASGAAVSYQVTLPSSRTLVANVVDRASTDVVVEIVDASGCRAFGTTWASAVVGPGPVTIRVRGASPSSDGEYALVARMD